MTKKEVVINKMFFLAVLLYAVKTNKQTNPECIPLSLIIKAEYENMAPTPISTSMDAHIGVHLPLPIDWG